MFRKGVNANVASDHFTKIAKLPQRIHPFPFFSCDFFKLFQLFQNCCLARLNVCLEAQAYQTRTFSTMSVHRRCSSAVFHWFHFKTSTSENTTLRRCDSPPPPALMCSWDSDRVSGISRPSGSVGLCRMSCMAFLRPVRPEAMKSAYVASTSDIAGASSTRRRLRKKHMSLYLYREEEEEEGGFGALSAAASRL